MEVAPKTQLLNRAVQLKLRPPAFDTVCSRQMRDGHPPLFRSTLTIETTTGKLNRFVSDDHNTIAEAEFDASVRALSYINADPTKKDIPLDEVPRSPTLPSIRHPYDHPDLTRVNDHSNFDSYFEPNNVRNKREFEAFTAGMRTLAEANRNRPEYSTSSPEAQMLDPFILQFQLDRLKIKMQAIADEMKNLASGGGIDAIERNRKANALVLAMSEAKAEYDRFDKEYRSWENGGGSGFREDGATKGRLPAIGTGRPSSK